VQLGITQTSELVNVTDFFNSHIVPDLQSADGENCCVMYLSLYTVLFVNTSTAVFSLPGIARVSHCDTGAEVT